MLKKRNDSWGKAVQGRLESCNDLIAEEAIYHSNCMTKFTKKTTPKVMGRPTDAQMAESLNLLCEWSEESSDCELYTLKELCEKMVEK